MIPGSIFSDSERPSGRYERFRAGPSASTAPQNSSFQNDNRELLERLINIFRLSELPGKEHGEQYLLHLYRKNCRHRTLETNQINIRLFLKFLRDQQNITHLDQVTSRSIEAFVEHEQDRGIKPKTLSVRLMSIYAFIRVMADGEVIHPDVLKKKVRVKVPESLPRAIDPEDVKALLAAVVHARDRAMILMLLRTGMRIGELLSLRLSDVNLGEKKVMIHEAQKTWVGRVVYFSDDAKEALLSWLKAKDPEQEFVFVSNRRRPLSYKAARLRFVKHIEAAGLAAKGYTIHCLRHTFASELLNAGMRLECLQQLLGHSNLEMTRRYARLTDRTREEEYFRAMATIEKGASGGHYRFDH
ncbi:MAG: tyrosine-type recombinase/integrase [Deltaproteobacteria bacterium]|jgi:site-specific recombinase XerD|nr:tyrosine-type recombinase/integrase [Deltaproteobacteria bacterium]